MFFSLFLPSGYMVTVVTVTVLAQLACPLKASTYPDKNLHNDIRCRIGAGKIIYPAPNDA